MWSPPSNSADSCGSLRGDFWRALIANRGRIALTAAGWSFWIGMIETDGHLSSLTSHDVPVQSGVAIENVEI